MGQGGDLPGFVQRSRGFDQHMHRNRALDAMPGADVVQRLDLGQGVVGTGDLGQHDVGDLTASTPDDEFEVGAPVGVGDIMDAGAEAPVAVCRIKNQAGDHRGVFRLAAGRGPIFAIAGDIEYRAPVDSEFSLQLQGLAQVLFRARIMLAGGKGGEGLFPAIQDVGRMKCGSHRNAAPVQAFIPAFPISRAGWRRRLALPATRPGSCPSSCASSRRWPGLRCACTRRSRR
jgi:hypothetical protein